MTSGPYISPLSPEFLTSAQALAADLGLSLVASIENVEDGAIVLSIGADGLALIKNTKQRTLPTRVDFLKPQLLRRLSQGDALFRKAIGAKSYQQVEIVDATAGFGVDSIVMAAMGYHVSMMERNPIVHALLADGLARAKLSDKAEMLECIARLSLRYGDFTQMDCTENSVDVVYLDPMFPERKKSALVKKDMQLFHELVGADDDQESYLQRALTMAKHRVIVKRPRLADRISSDEPSFVLSGKVFRFDIYTNKAWS